MLLRTLRSPGQFVISVSLLYLGLFYGPSLLAEDTNVLEVIRQLQQRISDLEQKVSALQADKEAQAQAIEAKAKKRIEELEEQLQANQNRKAVELAAKEAKAKDQITDLEQDVKHLVQKREQDKKAAAEKTQNASTITLGSNGLLVRSADSNFLMNLHGYIQADGRFHFDDGPANNNFLLRRVRPIIEGTVYDKFDYRLMADFGSGNASSSTSGNNALLDDAYVNARFWPQLQIQAGKYKSPVGLERLQSTAELLFVENGFATQLTPNYDLGVTVHNTLFSTPINYSVGVFNGAVDGGSSDSDTDNGKDIVGRLFIQPFLNTGKEPLRKFGFGVGGSAGRHAGALPTYRTPGQQTLFTYANGVVASGNQYRVDPQFYYFLGPFGVMGEYAISSQRVSKAPTTARFDHSAWQIQGSYFLTGDEDSFRSTSRHLFQPAHPFKPSAGEWGAFELVARFQRLSLDRDAFPAYVTSASASEATAWGVGLNWYLKSNLRLYLDYETTRFQGGSPAAGSVTAQDERVLFGRVQVSF